MSDTEHEQSLELPHPVDASSVSTSIAGSEVGAHPEQNYASSSTPAPTSTAAQDAPMGLPTNVAPITTAATATLAIPTTAIKAEDIDLIEKEWVAKAKSIVAQTHGDPYVQNKEINKIKAEYIKKRYNKDIKQSSD